MKRRVFTGALAFGAVWGPSVLRAEALPALKEVPSLAETFAEFKQIETSHGFVAPVTTPRAVLEKFAAMQMLDVHLPTTDGCERVLTRHTESEADLRLLIAQMKLELPAQPPRKIRTAHTQPNTAALPL